MAYRVQWHEYNDGIYFVTICSYNRKMIFGKIMYRRFYPSALGKLIMEHIERLPEFHSDIEIYNYVVMPNHVHLVISLAKQAVSSVRKNQGCLRPPKHDTPVEDYHHNSHLSIVIGALKAGVTRIALQNGIGKYPYWQPRFHDHVIRNGKSFEYIMNYVDNNVLCWDSDCFNK